MIFRNSDPPRLLNLIKISDPPPPLSFIRHLRVTDYTSSFHGLGKTKGLKLLKDNLSFQVRVHCLYTK